MKPSDLYVVSWSESQKAFHVGFAEDAMKLNLRYYYGLRDPEHDDWRILHIAESHSTAHSFLRQLKASMDAPPPRGLS